MRSNMVRITFGILFGSRIGKSTGNIGFIIAKAPVVLPKKRIIGPIPTDIALRSSGHIGCINSANPSGDINLIIASNTAHCFLTSRFGSGSSYPEGLD